jgi:outer membrane murein-binding lipoprotein Lpp
MWLNKKDKHTFSISHTTKGTEMRKFVMGLALVGVVLLSACTNNNQTSSDANAAQSLLPNISGYTVTDTNNIIDAITAAGAGAALTSGNVPVAAAISRAEVVLQCLQDQGAVGAKTYVQDNVTNIVPEAGVAIVINRDRVNENLLGCMMTTGQRMSAQTVDIVPCISSGDFTFQNDNYTFLYVGVGDQICGYFAQHYNNLLQPQ